MRTLRAAVDELRAVLEEVAGHVEQLFHLVGHDGGVVRVLRGFWIVD